MLRAVAIIPCVVMALCFVSNPALSARITGTVAVEYVLCEGENNFSTDCTDPVVELSAFIKVHSPKFDPWVIDATYGYIPSNWEIVEQFVTFNGTTSADILGPCNCDLSEYLDDGGFGTFDPGSAVELVQSGGSDIPDWAPLNLEFDTLFGMIQIHNSEDEVTNFYPGSGYDVFSCSYWFSTSSPECLLNITDHSYEFRVPEPNILSMFAIGLLGVLLVQRKRRL